MGYLEITYKSMYCRTVVHFFDVLGHLQIAQNQDRIM